MQEILQKIVEKWKGENLEIISAYSEKQVRGEFDKIGELISKDVLQVYKTIGGIADQDMDSNLLSFWTLEQIVAENSSHKSDFVLFGDFLIFSHLYGYKCESRVETEQQTSKCEFAIAMN
ncbi:MAG: hypothetical protein ABIP06_02420 [Pyrinomonadaceae bacterium]